MNITQEIYRCKTLHGVTQWLVSIAFAVLLLLVIYLAIITMVTGDRFFRWLGLLLQAEELVETLIAWQWLKYIVFTAVLACLMMILYRFSGPLKRPWTPVFPGAAAAALMIAAASLAFSFFIEHSTRYSLVYGSLTSMIILLIWLYLCGNILILGVVINRVFMEMGNPKSDGANKGGHDENCDPADEKMGVYQAK